MKIKTVSAILSNALLCFLLSFGAILCLTTAFDIEIAPGTLALGCCLWSLGCCILFSRPHGGWIVLCVFLLYFLRLWFRTQLQDQIIHLCYRISRIYNSAYGCGWLGKPMDVDSVTLPLYLWGRLIALIAAWCITRGRFTAVALLFALLPLGLCLVLTNTIPAIFCLFMLLAGLILVLLTQSTRRRDTSQAAALTWMLSIPVVLALALLFITNPQATYNKQHYADDLGDAVLRVVDRLPYVDFTEDGTLQFSAVRHIPDHVDLQDKGPNTQLRIPVMEVTAEGSGTLYLRGRDYDRYTGTQWTASGERSETFTSLHANTVNVYGIRPLAMGDLAIKTSGTRSSRYLPYYPDMNYHLQDGACNNPGSETAYVYNWYLLPDGFENAIHHRTDEFDGFFSSGTAQTNLPSDNDTPYFTVTVISPYAQYLQLPEDTKTWAETYLAMQLPNLSENDSVSLIAGAIADLVRGSADYDLDTPRMPDGSQDFARWFLEESDTGYCIHYATATTVLLRAAGIPARYVEGYLTAAVAGRTVTVTEADAHAWTEYYVAGLGWIPLESTAGDRYSGTPPVAPSTASDPSQDTTAAPAVTETPTEPSADSTEPSNLTEAPADPTAGRPGADTPGSTVPAGPQQPEDKPFAVNRPVVTGLCLLLLLLVQYPIRLRLREKYLRSGTANSRAVKYWRLASRLAKLSHQPLPDELEELALRSRFSQHTLTEADLKPFDSFRAETVRQLAAGPWWLKLYHRLIWAAY